MVDTAAALKRPDPAPPLPDSFSVNELLRKLEAYPRASALGKWTREAVIGARAQQITGQFAQPWRLARSLRTDAAIFKALANRNAPLKGLPRAFKSKKKNGLEERIRREAAATFDPRTSRSLSFAVLNDLTECLAMHGLAIGKITARARKDGTRVDFALRMWPLDAVRYDSYRERLVAVTTTGEEDIVHGDGRWIVIADHDLEPWAHGALVALALVWMDRAGAIQDRASNAESHGEEKWLAWLPEGVSIQSDDGAAVLNQLIALYQRRRAAIFPFGAEVKREEAVSQNWQIFKEILASDNNDISGILLGQEVTAAGGNYVKDAFLFGVRADIIEGDLRALEVALATGFFRPWSLVNFDVYDDLSLVWLLPDADEDKRRESLAKRHEEFTATIRRYREAGFIVDDVFAERLGESLGLEDIPKLAPIKRSGVEFFAYDYESGAPRIFEIRAAKGQEPRGDEIDNMTVPEYKMYLEEQKAERAAARERRAAEEQAQRDAEASLDDPAAVSPAEDIAGEGAVDPAPAEE